MKLVISFILDMILAFMIILCALVIASIAMFILTVEVIIPLLSWMEGI